MLTNDLNYAENEAAELSGLDVDRISAGIVDDTFIGIKFDNVFIGHAWYDKRDSSIFHVYVATHKLNRLVQHNE